MCGLLHKRLCPLPRQSEGVNTVPDLDPLSLIFIIAGGGLGLMICVSGIFTCLATWNSFRVIKISGEMLSNLKVLSVIMKSMTDKLDTIYDKQSDLNMEILKCRTTQPPGCSDTKPTVHF